MKIGELAKQSGLNASAIRYYEQRAYSPLHTESAANGATQETPSIVFF